jgi:hypothetical protein
LMRLLPCRSSRPEDLPTGAVWRRLWLLERQVSGWGLVFPPVRSPCPPGIQRASSPRGRERHSYLSLFDGGWPNAPHRVLHNSIVDAWNNAGRPKAGMRPREKKVIGHTANGKAILRYDDTPPTAGMSGDWEACALYAGQSTGTIREIKSAGSIVETIVRDARETILSLAGAV